MVFAFTVDITYLKELKMKLREKGKLVRGMLIWCERLWRETEPAANSISANKSSLLPAFMNCFRIFHLTKWQTDATYCSNVIIPQLRNYFSPGFCDFKGGQMKFQCSKIIFPLAWSDSSTGANGNNYTMITPPKVLSLKKMYTFF